MLANEQLTAALKEIGVLKAALGGHAMGAGVDLAKRKRGEAAVAQLAAIVESSDDAIVGKDLREIVTGWNVSAEKIFGYLADEMIGQSMNRLILPSRQGEETELRRRIEQGEIVRQFESVWVCKDGGPLDVSVNVSAILDTEGRIVGVSMMARDITQVERIGKAQAASELRYRRLFETAKDGILILDGQTGMVVDVNPFLVTLLGYSHQQFLGKAIWELGFFKDIAANEEKFAELRDKEYVRYENLPLESSEGRRIEVEFVSNVYLVNGQKVIQCNIRDISARQQAAEALRQEQALFTSLASTIPDHIYFKDRQSRFIRVNEANARELGLRSPDEAIGKTDAEIFCSEHARQAFADEQRLMETGEPMIGFEVKETWPDGRVTWVSTTKVPRRDAAGRIIGLVGVSRDITEHKRAEDALRLSRTLMDQSNDTLEVIDLKSGRVLDVNERGPTELGYSRAEYLALRVFDIYPLIKEAAWPPIANTIRATLRLYRNGQEVASTPCTSLSQIAPSALGFGAKLDGGIEPERTTAGFWDGTLDELAVFHRALNAAEILSLYDAAR